MELNNKLGYKIRRPTKGNGKTREKGKLPIEFVDADIPDVEKKASKGISILVDLLVREYQRKHSRENEHRKVKFINLGDLS